MNRTLLLILFLSLGANIHSQSERYDQMGFWTSLSIQNLELVNTADEEFSPYIWSEYLIYIGLQKKEGLLKNNQPSYFDLKASLLNPESTLPNFVFSNELNSQFHEGPISWDQKNNKIYFTRANSENGQAIVDSMGRQLLQIYEADYAQGKWENIGKLSFSDGQENYCHPTIFNGSTKMIFASSKAGGMGKMDLYTVDKNDTGSWNEAMILGDQVNQSGNQWFPFVLNDQHLFYASDIGDGQGLDVYYCRLDESGKAGNSQRLPYPINTSYDDFGLIFSDDGHKAYMSSNRPEGKGKDDIYQLIFPGDVLTTNTQIESTQTSTKYETNSKQENAIIIKEPKQSPNQEPIFVPTASKSPNLTEKTDHEIAEDQTIEKEGTKSMVEPMLQSESKPEAKTVDQRNTTKTLSSDECLISVLDGKENLRLSKAKINMYSIPSEIVNSFQYQVESSASVLLLEAMADNISDKKEFITNDFGQLTLKLSENSFLYLVVKKEGYKEQATLLNSSLSINELILELEKK